MLPKRLNILPPYIASFVFARHPRPPFEEILNWLFQADKANRASKYIQRVDEISDFKEIWFTGIDHPFYYPKNSRWIDLCQTVDECMNAGNWHHFITTETPITSSDVIVDCGAAEGLFSFVVADRVSEVYTIEPIPSWHPALEKTFEAFPNVKIFKCGVGHKASILNMTDDEIFSRISTEGNLQIDIRTVDEIVPDKTITFLKADIEGYEFPMLLGAENTIRTSKPKIALTVYHDGNDVSEIVNYLKYINPKYRFKTKGISANGNPVLLTAY